MTASNDQVFEDLVDNFAKIEQDENKNVDEQENVEEQKEVQQGRDVAGTLIVKGDEVTFEDSILNNYGAINYSGTIQTIWDDGSVDIEYTVGPGGSLSDTFDIKRNRVRKLEKAEEMEEKKKPPVCKKCDKKHWPFQECPTKESVEKEDSQALSTENTNEGKNPKQGDKEKEQLKKLREEGRDFKSLDDAIQELFDVSGDWYAGFGAISKKYEEAVGSILRRMKDQFGVDKVVRALKKDIAETEEEAKPTLTELKFWAETLGVKVGVLIERNSPKQGNSEKELLKKLSEQGKKDFPERVTVVVEVYGPDLKSILNLVPDVEIKPESAAELLVEDLISRYFSVEYFNPDDLREMFGA